MKPAMELLKIFFVQRAILYAIISIFSFVVLVPLGDLRLRFTDDHCSRCLLYTDVTFLNTSGQLPEFKIDQFGDQEICEYSIAVLSVFCLIYPLVALCYYLYLYRKDAVEPRHESKTDLGHFLFLTHVLLEVAMVILTLVSAAMVTRGFEHLCHSLSVGQDIRPDLDLGCSAYSSFDTSWGVYDGSNFYNLLIVALIGSWLVFVSWLLQSMLGIWKLWRLNMLPVINFPCCNDD